MIVGRRAASLNRLSRLANAGRFPVCVVPQLRSQTTSHPATDDGLHSLTVGGPPVSSRPKLVILGSGWAAVNVLRNLDKRALAQYQIHICSTANHFVNTPLLPSVTVGTMEGRSIVEPIRNFVAWHREKHPETSIKFNEVQANHIDYTKKEVKVTTRGKEPRVFEGVGSACDNREYTLPYDVLVCAVGATTNTFGTPGALEHCAFVKTVPDALKLRTAILDCFETASVFGTPSDEIDRLLTFTIIGAGPTGVEIAAELRDFVKEDVQPKYAGFAERNIRVQIVEMSPKMLGTYESVISEYTAKQFKRNDIEMYTQHRVTKVNPRSVEATDLRTDEKKVLPFGVCVWASGVCPNLVSLELAKELQDGRMLEVDTNLRVKGAEGSIFALGDCAKIHYPTMREKAKELFAIADVNKDGTLDEDEFATMITRARKDFPHLEAYMGSVSQEAMSGLYKKAVDSGKDARVTFEDFEAALSEVDKELKMLPPTAQVATQQGTYLAKILNSIPFEKLDEKDGFEPPFEYDHQGSMAYVGGEHAVIQSPIFGVSAGLITYIMWKGVYWGKSISFRMKCMMLFDWAKTWFLGRDTSRF